MNLYHLQSHIVIFLPLLIVPLGILAQKEDQKTVESYDLAEPTDYTHPEGEDINQAFEEGAQDNTDLPLLNLENYHDDEPLNPSDDYDAFPAYDELIDTTTTEKPKSKGKKSTRKNNVQEKKDKKPVRPPIKRPERDQLKCTSDFDCFYGQYCAAEEGLCFDKGEANYGDSCQRNGDCIKNLKCIANHCSTLGQEKDFCQNSEQCRAPFYCNKKSETCRKKRYPGEECHRNEHCFNSICLEPQKKPEPVSQRFPNQRQKKQKKYCAIIGATKQEHCDPWSYHCEIGFVCELRQQRASNGRRGQGRPGQGRPGQGRPGQGRPGQGRPGQGRPGQGRPGQGSTGGFFNPRPNQSRQNFRPIRQRQRTAGAQRSFRYKRQLQYQNYDHYYEDYNENTYGNGMETRPNYVDTYDEFSQLSPQKLPVPNRRKNPVLQMKLSKANRASVEKRLQRHQCKALSSLGSGEPCQGSIECRCGEFCSLRGICEPATCDLASAGICQQYPGFNAKFQCRNGLCMPPANDFNGIFINNPIFGTAFNATNTTTASPTFLG